MCSESIRTSSALADTRRLDDVNSSTPTTIIRTAALAHIRDRKLIQTRSVGKTAFYMAGGKIDPGETPEQALHREIREELDVDLVDGTVTFLDVFEAHAFGHSADTGLHMSCYLAEMAGDPHPTSEIAEFRYFTLAEYAAMDEVAPGSLKVFHRLASMDLID
jgi:8-oxo-dGTP diphosphatase|eukprot:gene28690-biopygen24186